MPAPWWLPFGRVPELSVRELGDMLGKQDLQVIDVRTPVEFNAGHIAGAVNVPINELPHRLDSLRLDPARPVVAICATAHRSIPAVRLLRKSGYSQAVQLKGGMIAWNAARMPTIR